MATTKYWVLGSGDWDSPDHWAETPNATVGGATQPLWSDPVVFNRNSGTADLVVNLPVDSNKALCASLDATAFNRYNLTFGTSTDINSPQYITVGGRLSLPRTASFAQGTSVIISAPSTPCYLLSNGVIFYSLTLTKGTLSLMDDLYLYGVNPDYTLLIQGGTFNSFGMSVIGLNDLSGIKIRPFSSITPIVANFGFSSITAGSFQIADVGGIVTFTPPATLTSLGLISARQSISSTFNNIIFKGPASYNRIVRFDGQANATSVTIDSSVNTFLVTSGSALGAGNWSKLGTNICTIKPAVTGSYYHFSKTGGGTVTLDYINIKYCQGDPVTSPTTWFADINSIDSGNNLGWTFIGEATCTYNPAPITKTFNSAGGTIPLATISPVTTPCAGGAWEISVPTVDRSWLSLSIGSGPVYSVYSTGNTSVDITVTAIANNGENARNSVLETVGFPPTFSTTITQEPLQACTYTPLTVSKTYDSAGGTAPLVTVTPSNPPCAGGSWSITVPLSDRNWLSLSIGSGMPSYTVSGSGSSSVDVLATVASDLSTEGAVSIRTTTLLVTGLPSTTITVTQQPLPTCTYNSIIMSTNYSKSGGTAELLTIRPSHSPCKNGPWTISVPVIDQTWLSLSTATSAGSTISGSGDEVVTINAVLLDNTTALSRTSLLDITGIPSSSITINQAGVVQLPIPSPPVDVTVISLTNGGKVSWGVPRGVYPVTKYKIVLHSVYASFIPIEGFVFTGDNLSISFFGLDSNFQYYFVLTSINSTADGDFESSPVTSGVFMPGNVTVINPVDTVDVSYNYKQFYDAPIELNSASPDFGNYLYPSSVSKDIFAIIYNDKLKNNIFISSTTFNALSIKYKELNSIIEQYYFIPLDHQIYSTFTELVDELQYKVSGMPLTVIGTTTVFENDTVNTLIFQATTATSSFEPSTVIPTIYGIQYNNVNSFVFGDTPTVLPYYSEELVKNSIPTAEYDAITKKCLVENLPIVNVVDQFLYTKEEVPSNDPSKIIISLDYFDDVLKQPRYLFKIPFLFIKPKKVDIFWLNNDGSYTHLGDYNGDGILYEKIKTVDSLGNTVYILEPLDTVNGYGKIDYVSGNVTGLYLKNYKKTAVIGQDVIYPLTITAGNLDLIIGNSDVSISVPAGTYVNAGDLAKTLNSASDINSLAYNNLTAGYINNQIYIENNTLGYNEKISLRNRSGNLNIQIFGFSAIIVSPPRIYVSFSYLLNTYDKNKYTWYQTPHFRLNVIDKNNAVLFTQAHLDYILNKIKILKPITTVFEGINIKSTYTDNSDIYDAFSLKEYRNLTTPLIVATLPNISLNPGPPTNTPSEPLHGNSPYIAEINPADVKIINPDNQEYTLPAAFLLT